MNHFIDQNTLLGPSHRVETILGAGSFGVVAKCRNIETNQSVAIKVNKPAPGVFHQARVEIHNLKKLRCLNPETSNIIHWQGFFFHGANICLIFELLDQSLCEYMRNRPDEGECPGLPMPEVRAVLHQMSSALYHLSSVGIVHADIKPENIMVVNRNEKPIRVKLIDFGLSLMVSDCQPGVCAGTLSYMAPEMILAMPFNEAIDMWSLGQAAVEIITGFPMYPGNSPYEIIRFIVETQGQPEDYLLDQGLATEEVFSLQRDGPQRWKFRTPEDFGYMPVETRTYFLRSLDDLVDIMDWQRECHRDHHLVLDLLKRMLCLDQEKRIKPLEVLQHPFLSESLPLSPCADTNINMNNAEEVKPEEDQHPSESQTAGPQEEDSRVQTRNSYQAEEPVHEDIWIRRETTSQAGEPEVERSQDEEIQPESREKKVGFFRRVFQHIRNAFQPRLRRQPRRSPRSPLETTV